MAKQALTPWLGSFTLNDQNAHKLSDILADTNYISADNQPYLGNVPLCQFLVIGNDINNGGKKLYVGNSGLTTSYYGKCLVASQEVPYYSMDANLIHLDHIWVLGDTNGLVVTVNLLTR